ncbi:hypothetical protein AGABI1DRAFT_77080 [Agaricus bisporus var. burnettii JB137-S8]|uniref:Pyridoxamine 5'-phosphate oxidase N-terminal domain-containing protein n=1 Tax=Agaricus bisporus var. burnettii (strain JB137-S8 / ATCC MYA-4627 / FGSC 10392) TaxID=597362 RepID=K5VT28_AGABU|nr:uncharacterized protein AGABI1DRAFT_77080 [Agaricus bisporus var. burnettii JB137-S8]EKM77584.1 hypothetical protein AGABI1DRAFT_77080 [Agaricus bisporus var. burnettii JB137-S8]
MVKHYDEIPDFIIPWIKEQKLFWVATAPLSPEGHVNVSPKGIFDGNFNVVDSHRVWYEDMTGSGIETISHIRENGRITVMFNAFQGPPRICRLYGKGTVHEFDTPEYNALLSGSKRQPGSRSIIVVDIYHVSTSCGYSIPFFSFAGYRTKLHSYLANLQNMDCAAEKTNDAPSEKGLKSYWKDKNMESLDGLSGLNSAYNSRAGYDYIDLKSFETRPNRKKPLWLNTQVTAAFMFGAVAGATLLRVLQR